MKRKYHGEPGEGGLCGKFNSFFPSPLFVVKQWSVTIKCFNILLRQSEIFDKKSWVFPPEQV